MFLSILKILLLILFSLFSFSCEKNNVYPWSKDSLDNIIAENLEKMILVDFETDWWTWCDRLDNDTYSDKRIIKYASENLISIKIDAEKGIGPEQKETYRVRGYPTILLLDPSGNEIDRIVGYRPPDEFMSELERIKSGTNTLSFLQSKYLRNMDDPSLELTLAEKYIDLNVKDSAEKHLRNALQYYEQESEFSFQRIFNISQLYYRIGSIDVSIELLDNLVEDNRDSSETAYFYGLLYKAKVNNKIDDLNRYVSITDNIEWKKLSYWQIMRIIKKSGEDPDLEASVYLKAVNLYDENYKYLPSLLNGFAWRMTELGRNLPIALEKVNIALEYGEDIQILDTKAEVLWKLGRTEDALDAINKCIQGDPNKKHYQDQKVKFLENNNI